MRFFMIILLYLDITNGEYYTQSDQEKARSDWARTRTS